MRKIGQNLLFAKKQIGRERCRCFIQHQFGKTIETGY